jgi:hypothetical protein
LTVLVGQQVLGQFGFAHGGSHNTVAARRALQTIPVHGVATEDVGQAPIRNAKLAKKQRAFDLFVRPVMYGMTNEGRMLYALPSLRSMRRILKTAFSDTRPSFNS